MPRNNLLLTIAIDDYDSRNWEKLNNPVSDANRLANILENSYGFTVKSLFNLKKREIFDFIESELSAVNNNENLLIYFAGHGYLNESHGYWIADDSTMDSSTWISNDEIIGKLINCNAHHTLLIADCCFSGSLIQKNKEQVVYQNNFYNDSKGSRIIISAGRSYEPVKEGRLKSGSPFSNAINEFLENNVQKDVTTESLFSGVADSLKKSETHQIPQIGSINCEKHEGGQFVFSLSKVALKNIENKKKEILLSKTRELTLTEDYIPRSVYAFNKSEDQVNFFNHFDSSGSLKDFIVDNKHLILLAPAGLGKSQELIYHAQTLLSEGQYIPIFAHTRRYTQGPIETLLPQNWADFEDEVILFFDSVDEILPAQMDIFKRELETFLEKYPDLKLILSCRTNFYQNPQNGFGVLSSFKQVYLQELTHADVRQYLRYIYKVDGAEFVQEAMKRDYAGLISTPFFLKLLASHYASVGDLSIAKLELLHDSLEKEYKKDRERFELDGYPAFQHLFVKMKKMAFIMQHSGKTDLTENELAEIFDSEQDLNQAKRYFPFFSKNHDEHFDFIHNNFREYLASKFLSSLPFPKVVELIRVNRGPLKGVQASWFNTVSLLLSENGNGELFSWILDNDPEILIQSESQNLSHEQRYQVFVRIFTFYSEKNIWLDSKKFSKYQLSHFSDFGDCLDFLLDFIEDKSSKRTGIYNAVEIIRHYSSATFVNSTKACKEVFYQLLFDSRLNNYDKLAVMRAMADLKFNDSDTISKVVSRYSSTSNQALRAGMYALIHMSNYVNEFSAILFDGLDRSRRADWKDDRDDTNLSDEGIHLRLGLEKINAPEPLRELLEILTRVGVYQKGCDSEDFLKSLFENCLELFKQDASSLSVILTFVKGNSYYIKSGAGDEFVNFLHLSNNSYKGLLFLLENYDYHSDGIIGLILNDTVYDRLICDYTKKSVSSSTLCKLHQILSSYRSPNANTAFIFGIKKALKEVDGIEFTEPSNDFDFATHNKIDLNVLFSNDLFKSHINEVFEILGVDFLSWENHGILYQREFDSVSREVKNWISYRLAFDKKYSHEMLLNEINNPSFELEKIPRVFSFLKRITDVITLTPDQVLILESWCGREYDSYENWEKQYFFTTRLNLRLPEHIAIGLALNYFKQNIQEDIEEEGVIESLMPSIQNINKLFLALSQALEKPDFGNSYRLNSIIGFVLRNKHVEYYGLLVQALVEVESNGYLFVNALRFWHERSNNPLQLKKIIEDCKSDYIRWEAVKMIQKVRTEHVFLVGYLQRIINADDSDIEIKFKAANVLMELNEKTGFDFTAHYILQKNDPNLEYAIITSGFQFLTDRSCLNTLGKLACQGLGSSFRNRHNEVFNSLSQPSLDAIYKIGVQSIEDYLEAKDCLLSIINLSSNDGEFDYIYSNILRMEEQLKINSVKKVTLTESLSMYNRLLDV